MFRAFARAVTDVFAPPLRRVVGLSLALALACFVGLWIAVAIVLRATVHFGWRPLDWLVDLLGAIAVAGLSWLLFPAVVTIVTGFFLDRIAAAVEALDYPGRGPPRPIAIGETINVTLRLMVVTVLLNLLALPVYVLVPGVNFFVFVGLNGYLFGREYFEVVALRRLDRTAVRMLRRRFAGRLLLAGMAIAGIFAVPLVNLVAPVVATAFMVHIVEGLPHAGLQRPAA